MKTPLFFLTFVIICCTKICTAQEEQKPGFQLGYSYPGLSRIDVGANYYWVFVQITDKKTGDLQFHTVGPSAGLNMLLLPNRTIVGMQAGINYHLYLTVCPRININYENYFNGDQRIGAELGGSLAGLFAYAGYYLPVGHTETKGVSAFRLGLRFIFNMALIDAAPPE